MPVQFTSMGFMLALVAGVAAFHVAICLYAIANPAIVAAEVARPSRSFLAWAYLSALRVGRNDSEMDLVQSGLPSDAVVANCRRRAVMALGFSLLSIGSIAIASLVGLFAGHLWAQNRPHKSGHAHDRAALPGRTTLYVRRFLHAGLRFQVQCDVDFLIHMCFGAEFIAPSLS